MARVTKSSSPAFGSPAWDAKYGIKRKGAKAEPEEETSTKDPRSKVLTAKQKRAAALAARFKGKAAA